MTPGRMPVLGLIIFGLLSFNAFAQSVETSPPAAYLVVEVRFVADGYWPIGINLSAESTTTYVTRRKLRCQLGPMLPNDAQILFAQLKVDRAKLLRSLGAPVDNDARGFKNLADECRVPVSFRP